MVKGNSVAETSWVGGDEMDKGGLKGDWWGSSKNSMNMQ